MSIRVIIQSIGIWIFILSCGPNASHTESISNTDDWPEMDAFHMTMAEAFHPLKDTGNVEPANRLMTKLADEAEEWAKAPLPEKVNNDGMKARLQKLKSDLRTLAREISNGAPEDQVGTALYSIHDQFHEIMEVWHGESIKHQHEGKQ
jgi:hypothetical protein